MSPGERFGDAASRDGDELSRALSFLGWPGDAAGFRRAVRRIAAAAAGVVGVVVVALTSSPIPAIALAGAAALVVVVGSRVGARTFARLRRTRALGDAGSLVSLVVLRMRIEPTVETAVDFAATVGDGALAESLCGHTRRARGTGRAGLDEFSSEWAPWFPATKRAVGLVDAAASAPDGDRERTLDRALATVRRETRERLADFTGEVRGPVSGLYAFGVLLPLALVGLLPAANVAGLSLSVGAVALVYDLLLPLALLGAGVWLLSRRPVAFPPPRVDRGHPDVPDRRAHALAAAVAAGGLGWVVAGETVASWASPVAAVGFGVGVALVVVAHGAKRIRDRTRAVEAGLADALTLVGRRVADGEAVETALASVGSEVGGPVGARLEDATHRMCRLGECPRRALCGPSGAFDDVPSRRVGDATSVLALAATEGRPAGDALVSLATQLDELAAVESEARRELGRITDTLTNTATAFGPLVAGATVALAGRVASEGTSPLGGGLPVDSLALAVGGYVLVSAVVLTSLSTALVRGLDPALVTYRVGVALPTATATYLAAVVGAGLLVGV